MNFLIKKLIIFAVTTGAMNVGAQTELPFMSGCMFGTANSCFELVKQTELQFGGYICVYENAYGRRRVYKSSFQECHQQIEVR
jgi:hypothetical protein